MGVAWGWVLGGVELFHAGAGAGKGDGARAGVVAAWAAGAGVRRRGGGGVPGGRGSARRCGSGRGLGAEGGALIPKATTTGGFSTSEVHQTVEERKKKS